MSDPEVIEALEAVGLDGATARRAVEEDRVALVLVEQMLGARRQLSFEDLVERSGAHPQLYRMWERALGLPPRDRFSEEDVEHARALGNLLRMFPADVDGLSSMLRTDGRVLARMAMSNLHIIRDHLVQPLRDEGVGDVGVAIALAEAANSLLPLVTGVVGGSYRRVLEDHLSSELVAAATRGATDTVQLAVGFVDVTGFTSLSARVDPAGLEDVIDAFETRCYTVAGTRPGLQLVKFLGDAAMYVSVDPVRLIDALLDLVEPADEDSPLADVPMRGGAAAGGVLPRSGDYFGTPVNLAARLTDRARDGTVLAAESLRDQLSGVFDVRRLAPMRLHGFGRHRPVRVRPRVGTDAA